MIHFLERAAPEIIERPLSANNQYWAVGSPGIRNSGHTVGNPGTGGQYRAAYLAWIQSAPRVSRMYRCLFVPDVNDLDTFVQATIVNGHHVTAT